MKKKKIIPKIVEETQEIFDRYPGRPLTSEEATCQLLAGLPIEVYNAFKHKWDVISDKKYHFSSYDEYFRVPEASNEFIRVLQDDVRDLQGQIKDLQGQIERILFPYD